MDNRIANLEKQMSKINIFCASFTQSSDTQAKTIDQLVDLQKELGARVEENRATLMKFIGTQEADIENTKLLNARIKSLEEKIKQMVQVEIRWRNQYGEQLQQLEARIGDLDARLTALNGSVAQMLEFNENLKLRM